MTIYKLAGTEKKAEKDAEVLKEPLVIVFAEMFLIEKLKRGKRKWRMKDSTQFLFQFGFFYYKFC